MKTSELRSTSNPCASARVSGFKSGVPMSGAVSGTTMLFAMAAKTGRPAASVFGRASPIVRSFVHSIARSFMLRKIL